MPQSAARPDYRAVPPSLSPGSSNPPVTSDPSRASEQSALPPKRRSSRKRTRRRVAALLVLVLIAVIAWPVGLVVWAGGKLHRVEALSGAPSTSGTTYLLAGSDARGGVIPQDGTEGSRSDSIVLVHKPPSGPTAMISIPRDTYVEIPGYGGQKINAAYSLGGPHLLVSTVEGLTGWTVDHYVEIGMDGVAQLVDAVGGVTLCYDATVNDADSGLVWEAGCHVSDGTTALAFARMRKSDPLGDIGRADRQRQVIAATISELKDPKVLLDPRSQLSVARGGLSAVTVDESMGIVDLGRLALAFRAATSPDGITGTPPIASLDYEPGGIGSAVLLDPEATPVFFDQIAAGTLPPGQVNALS